MTSPISVNLGDNPAENRRIWAERLRQPDWLQVPAPAGPEQECRNPWDVGVALAMGCWPPGIAIIDEYIDLLDAEEEIMPACYGLRGENGEFAVAELPDRIRSIVLMAAQAARSASPYHDDRVEMSRDIVAGFHEDSEWCLYILSDCLMMLWEYARSPMRGAVLPPDEIARLIADILDAAPPSLLTSPDADAPEA